MIRISQKIYRQLIRFYPEDFQRQHGLEMDQTFADMQTDFGVFKTWLKILPDFFSSVFIINFKTIMEKSSLQFKLAMWGLVFIAPFALLSIAAIFGNLLGVPVNNAIGQQISHNIVVAKLILIYLPLAAFLLNIVPLTTNALGQKPLSNVITLQFVRVNFLSLVVAVAAIGSIVLLKAHDGIPCMVHGLINQGFHNIKPLLQVCRNA